MATTNQQAEESFEQLQALVSSATKDEAPILARKILNLTVTTQERLDACLQLVRSLFDLSFSEALVMQVANRMQTLYRSFVMTQTTLNTSTDIYRQLMTHIVTEHILPKWDT